MKKTMVCLLMLMCSISAFAEGKYRMVKFPAAFNAFYDNEKDRINPQTAYMTCRLENRQVGTVIDSQAFGSLLHIEGSYYMNMNLSDDLASKFDSNAFDVNCWTSQPAGYTCRAVINPGEYTGQCN